MWPRPIGLESHSTRRSRFGRGRARRGRVCAGPSARAGPDATPPAASEHEVADELVDLHRVAAEEPVAAAVERDQAGARESPRPASARASTARSCRGCRGARASGRGPGRADRSTLTPSMAPQGLDQDLRRGLAGPRHAVLDALERVRLREDPLEQADAASRRSRRGSPGRRYPRTAAASTRRTARRAGPGGRAGRDARPRTGMPAAPAHENATSAKGGRATSSSTASRSP